VLTDAESNQSGGKEAGENISGDRHDGGHVDADDDHADLHGKRWIVHSFHVLQICPVQIHVQEEPLLKIGVLRRSVGPPTAFNAAQLPFVCQDNGESGRQCLLQARPKCAATISFTGTTISCVFTGTTLSCIFTGTTISCIFTGTTISCIFTGTTISCIFTGTTISCIFTGTTISCIFTGTTISCIL